MAQISKNARTTTATHRFYCPCGGEIKMKTIFENGKVKTSLNAKNANGLNVAPRILNKRTRAGTLISEEGLSDT